MFGLAEHGSHQEPMTLGSPASSPGGHHHPTPSQFLPGYLLGDASPMPASPAGPRLWSTTSSSSPPKTTSRASSWTTPLSPHGGHTPRTDSRNRDMVGHRPKDKTGAPPVQGLFETFSTPSRPSTDPRMVDYSAGAPRTPSTSFAARTAHESSLGLQSSSLFSPGSATSFNQSRKTPPSPAQIDPFYTQGEAIQPEDELDETWITVFGFPPNTASFILQQFSQYGNITRHVIANEGNWMHIHYQSKLQAKKALSKNGKVFGNIMVGVTPCIDKSIMDGEKENRDMSSTLDTSTQNTSVRDSSSMTKVGIRPLTAAYQAASADHQVVQSSNTPRKSNNVLSKAMDYMFGW
ncbi:nucleoporin NUP53 [Lingula anatina]|uniref:Nucleoporin NUP53 n=1 Tax=Lingula anatina TaxID=7574 RepID=A0A1S3JGF9_LINAN|nr:nucleoporin NUP53 [Lingula anatina]|eukprot:XP_013408984.1 nucleoporin NUP53 [Lingula anatina]